MNPLSLSKLNLKKEILFYSPLIFLISISFLILITTSHIRHFLFQSNALDLGWFDQAVYLISIGKTPIVSFSDFHILGDHASFMFYLIAILYKIHPSVSWLFFLQALALSITVIPIYQLSSEAKLSHKDSITICLVYLLYPLTFNVNLFDFHPEVIALPCLLWAIYAARINHLLGFCLSLIIILSCKAVLSLTVLGMGFWLFFFDRKKIYGAIALGLGASWFILTTQVIIPQFSGAEAAAVYRYSFLGDSVVEIILNLFLKPQIILGKIFTLANIEYLVFLLIPLIWGLYPRYFAPIVAAFPALALNLITDYRPQKDLVHQYSLPILPFLLLIVITTFAHNKAWFQQRWKIIAWVMIAFLALGKYGYFTSIYLEQVDTLSAMRTAVNLVPPQVSILTSPQIAPHVTHRQIVDLAIKDEDLSNLEEWEVILLNQRHPSWPDSEETVRNLVQQLKQSKQFTLQFQQDDVFLFNKQ
ncbi:MAG: DUF2079 domain-containing protein [Microcystaceae cyanobacterium]